MTEQWEENWLPIPGYDGYEVSDYGNVRSYYLKGNHKRKRAEFPRVLALRGGRYPSVSLPKPDGGGYHSRRVHQLVMLAFVGPCPEGQEVAHLNGNSSDNRLANLAYVTHAENESHKALHGTCGAGEGNSNAMLQGWQVAEIKYLASKSIPQGRIAALFEISHRQVNDILNGRTWVSEPARTDIPWLVEQVRELEAENERLRTALRRKENHRARARERARQRDEVVERVRAILTREHIPGEDWYEDSARVADAIAALDGDGR